MCQISNITASGKVFDRQPMLHNLLPHSLHFSGLSTRLIVAIDKKVSGLYTLASSSKNRASNHTFNVNAVLNPMNSTNLASTSCNNLARNSKVLDVLHTRLVHTSFSKMHYITNCKPYLSKDFFYDTGVLAKFHKIFVATTKTFLPCSYGYLGSLQGK